MPRLTILGLAGILELYRALGSKTSFYKTRLDRSLNPVQFSLKRLPDSSIIDSSIITNGIIDSTLIDSTLIDSTIRDSTIIDSTITDSTITG